MSEISERVRSFCECNIETSPCGAEEMCRQDIEIADHIDALEAEIERLKDELTVWKSWSDDDPLPEDDAIHKAHPLETGRHDLYGEAQRLVSAKRSKGALVALVNWQLAENARLKDELKVNPCALLGKCVGPSMTKDGARLVAENARLRGALSFYASPATYNLGEGDPPFDLRIEADCGRRARAALGVEGEDP